MPNLVDEVRTFPYDAFPEHAKQLGVRSCAPRSTLPPPRTPALPSSRSLPNLPLPSLRLLALPARPLRTITPPPPLPLHRPSVMRSNRC